MFAVIGEKNIAVPMMRVMSHLSVLVKTVYGLSEAWPTSASVEDPSAMTFGS